VVEIDAEDQVNRMPQIAERPHVIRQRPITVAAFILRASHSGVYRNCFVIRDKSDEVQDMPDGLARLVARKYDVRDDNGAGIDEGIARYAALMFWFCQLHAARRARLAYAIAFVALGIGLEFVQRALGYRTFEVWDMVADAVGVGAGWLVATFLKPGILERFERR